MANAGGTGRSLSLKLEGVTCNRDAIGAVVEVTVSGALPLVRSVRAGDLFLSQSSKWLHFGLGETGTVEKVTVRWPGGSAVEVVEGVSAEGRYRIKQGSEAAERWEGPGPVALGQAAASPSYRQGLRGRV